MDENKTALVKKIGEGNKSLSVIVAEEKLAKFKRFSQGLSLSMGWLLNQAIDRYLDSGSVDIFKTTIGDGDNTPKIPNLEAIDLNMEELVKSSIDSYLLKTTIGNDSGLTRHDVLDVVNTAIQETLAKLEMPNELTIGKFVTTALDERVTTSIEVVTEPISQSIEELRSELSEVSEFARNLQGEIVKVKKPLAIV
jgi:hypothetical protein